MLSGDGVRLGRVQMVNRNGSNDQFVDPNDTVLTVKSRILQGKNENSLNILYISGIAVLSPSFQTG
jgi:hypothetical protein